MTLCDSLVTWNFSFSQKRKIGPLISDVSGTPSIAYTLPHKQASLTHNFIFVVHTHTYIHIHTPRHTYNVSDSHDNKAF